jgi:hypothetical protein
MYGLVTGNTSHFDQTLSTSVRAEVNTVHCLDFYFFLTHELANQSVEVGWSSGPETELMGELKSVSESRWQRSRISYTTPWTQDHQVRARE